jgi:hypothetical protein
MSIGVPRLTGWRVGAVYALIALVMTWPVALTMGSRLASDVGDPAFVCWILAWDAGQIMAALGGDLSALANYWNGNIFYPAPLTLAYSEHFTAQALQIVPVYALTGNIILCYNLLFISTFALSGLAAFLLVRDLTGRRLAAFLAGLAYAYAPYRMGQFSHLQVLSSYWMPLALYGLHHYFARITMGSRGRALLWPLAGAAAALVMQNLSCAYYMMFFAPFVIGYCAYELVQRRLFTDVRVWTQLACAAAFVAVCTWPFITPYMRVRSLDGVGVRSVAEVVGFSADVQAFATAASGTHLFGETIRSFFKAEGEGFPGFTMTAFALLAIAAGMRRAIAHLPWRRMQDWAAVTLWLAAIVAVLAGIALGVFFVKGHVQLPLNGVTILYSAINPTLLLFSVAALVWLIVGVLVRWREPRPSPTAFGFFAVAVVSAALLALGPKIQSFGRTLGTGPYQWFFMYVPGWEGMRVPARFLMLVMLFLSVLAGLGAAEILRTRFRRTAAAFVLLAGLCVLAEGWVAPVPTNLPVRPNEGLAWPPEIEAGRRISPIYRVIRDLPARVVLAEFPFGDPAYEVRAVYYAGFHRRPIVNGFSGFFPPDYGRRAAYLADVLTRPAEAAEWLRESQATHALVHEGAYLDHRGPEVSAWLESLGARQVTRSGEDVLYVLAERR